MANVNFYLEVHGLDSMIKQFGAVGKGPTWKDTARFEATFAESYAAVADAVHVITGKLKGSGVPMTGYDGDTWWGEIEYARNPGIFELARGDVPTQNHPEGGHGFFDRVTPFIPRYEQNVDEFFRGAFDMGAGI